MKKIKLVLASMMMLAVVACGSSDKTSIELKKKEFVVEYGDVVSEDSKDYVKADKDVLKETGISFKDVKYENREVDGEEVKYLEVGTYKATAIYKDETLDFKIVVKDTTAPEFVDFQDKIEVEVDYKGDFSEFFEVEDFSDVVIKVDSEYVEREEPGNNVATVTAIDAYNNKAEKEVTVVVKEKATTEETEAETNEGSTTSGTVDSSSTGATGGSTNTSGGTGSTSTGGTTTTPSNPTPTPTEPIVQLTPTPFASQVFEDTDSASAWAKEICKDGQSRRDYAEEFGYTTITNWTTTQIAFGYASTGEVVYVKRAVVWTFQ